MMSTEWYKCYDPICEKSINTRSLWNYALFNMVKNQQTDGMYGHYLLASGLLGGLFPSIFLFNFDWHSELTCIVGNVPSSTKFLGSIAIVATSLAICKNKNSWISTTQGSVVARVKIFVLWILGIVVCIVHQTGTNIHIQLFPELTKTMSIVFIILQTLFLTAYSCCVFYESRKIKYIMSFLAVANMVNWLDTTVRSSILLTESNLTQLTENSNCPCFILMHGSPKTCYFHGELYVLPFHMEFSILAITILIGIPQTKKRENPRDTTLNHFDTTCRHLFLSGKQKLLVIIAATVLNTPFLFYVSVYPTSLADVFSINKIHVWLVSVIGVKIIIFVMITIAYHNLYKISNIKYQPIYLNFNDTALILGSAAVNASGVLNLFQMDSNPFTITFHSWFNIIYTLYQTFFILFLKCIVIRDKYSQWLVRVRMIVLILISYNILYWVKDSLFFLSFLKDDVHNKFIRSLFFLLYPSVSFYRFQSAMGMIPFLF